MGYKTSFEAKIWLYNGQSAWHFITVPSIITKHINAHHAHEKRGWGSLPVEVKIGTSKWKTSIFPDKDTGTYMLPVKKVVRTTEGIREGSEVEVNLMILT